MRAINPHLNLKRQARLGCLLIREVDVLDMPLVARLHRAAYGNMESHLTAQFSLHLLEEYYAALASCNPYSYIAFDGATHPVGFIFAGFKTSVSLKFFVREHALALTKVLLMNPRLLALTIARIMRPNRFNSRVPLRLFSIAVEPSYQGRGAGKALLAHFEERLRAHGIHEYGLSVRANNIQATQFYRANGFELEFSSCESSFFTKCLLE